jgi:DNA polymerase II large subunit
MVTAAPGYFDGAVEARLEEETDEAEDFDFDPPEVPLGSGRGASEDMERYFADLERRMRVEYELAARCRAKGMDPETRVEIPPAIDLAARVEELMKDYLPQRGVAERIRELSKIKNREETSLLVANEVAAGKFGAYDDKTKALDGAIRTGLAILTEGILVAPLEGIAGVRILNNDDGTDCVAVSFAGPIRAAGGTGQALSVLIADVVRRALGIGRYIATEKEISRMKEEIPAYKQAASLQYVPSNDEIELIMRSCPIMIDGEGTEKDEIGGNRDLPRIETNQIRGGACLVLAEGMTQKAPKIQKNVKALKLDGWEFIDQVIEIVKKKGQGGKEGSGKKFTDPWAKEADGERPSLEPSSKYLMDLIAGRPVFAYPSRKGGWRLRYGRSRTGGLATTSIHPAAMALCDDFIAAGTQMKIERPGKATACTPCDSIDPPIALLHNGSLVEVGSYKKAKALKGSVKSVIDLGEILIPYGEFAENNKPLPQAPWCEEWWTLVAEKALGGAAPQLSTSAEAFAFAARTATPLHPRWNLFWHDLSLDDVAALSRFVEAHGVWAPTPPGAAGEAEAFTLTLPRAAADAGDRGAKQLLVELGALHECEGDTVRLGRHAYAMLRGLGLDVAKDKIVRRHGLDAADTVGLAGTCALVSVLSGVKIRPRGMFRIGTRMGRPEKAAERKMNPPVHLLFPLGIAGGPQRLLADAVAANKIEIEIGERKCPKCGNPSLHYKCDNCGEHTESVKRTERIEARLVELAPMWEAALARLRIEAPETVKGVQGLVSRGKFPEPMEKGILRARHNLFTFKDATVRYDMINITLTHFKPREAHVTVEKLREMGYTKDAHGAPLERDDQLLELKVQDVIASTSCIEYMLRTSQYIDELLVRFYGFKAFYNCKTNEDIYGHLFVGLAPHTSGGVLCRVIGHTKAQGHYGHPYFHAAKRRNCDGDEDCLMLLLDGLLNFSRAYLPSNRGGLMDAPLTLTMRLDPNEVDKEAHNVDTMWRYPLEFFEATLKHPGPKDVEKIIDMVAKRLGKPEQYEGFGFTHDTRDIAEGPDMSAYKTIGSMMDKMTAQLELAARIRAVDAPDVAARVIGSHFLPDMMGNLKAFSKQAMRCTKCNAKYRRVPLTGKCRKCGNPALTMTVHEGSVKKYLEVSREVSQRFELDDYTKQRIEHVADSIESIFTNDRVKKAKLSDFF